ncbi:MAG TPA: hypothetical protein VF041_13395 [Gemmatimonadaceae bacterium]
MPNPVRGSTVLILSTDAATSGLLSVLAELEGYVPIVGVTADETPVQMIARIRPQVALVDCDHVAACNDEFYALAREMNVRVVTFSPGRMRDEVRAFAEERDLPWFTLPIDRSALASALRSALSALLPLALLTPFPH